MTIEDLLARSGHLHKLKEKPDLLFAELQRVSPEVLNEWEQVWSPKGNFWPVITLRFLVLKKLQRNEAVNMGVITELKAAIEQRQISHLHAFNEAFLKSLMNYKQSTIGMFPQWVDPFNILYQFFYPKKDKEETNELLSKLGNEIITEYGIKDAKVHIVGFDGSQNYGSTVAWAAIIPKEASSPQVAYQIFFEAKDGVIEGGFIKGHKLVDNKFKEEIRDYKSWSDFKNGITGFLPKWYDLNSKLDFSFSKDEMDFKKVLNKTEPEDRDVFFALMDELVRELEISDEEHSVFSPAQSKLSFQVGNRYCLYLKKNKFSFITPDNYEIKGIERGNFKGGSNAFFYHDVDRETVVKYYSAIARATKFELERKANFTEKYYDNAAFRQAVFNKEYRNTLFTPLIQVNIPETPVDMKNELSLNLILFGPPGTGKTYNTIDMAISIADPAFYEENKNNREMLNVRFKELLIQDWDNPKGQIAFCTFHQSFSYEDFVEGIKPYTTDDKNIYYEIQPGIFKNICLLANSNISTVKVINEGKVSLNADDFNKNMFFKMSLGDVNDPNDKPIYDYCKDKKYISFGFGGENDFTGLSEDQISKKCQELGFEKSTEQFLNRFIHKLKVGNYVLISNGNRFVRAMGKVTGDYEYKTNTGIRYNHFREVEWLFVDENIPIEELYDRNLTQVTLYELDKSGLKQEFFSAQAQRNILENRKGKKYVLIIDEINRGNIASIFGELITLIETNKRKGECEELELMLPYSKSPFSIPNNLYIIGTMNTADRSIESLDTALRRRFSFISMDPEPELIATVGKSKGKVDGVDLVQMLTIINERIEKLIDKDHKIGHSYFLDVESKDDLKLAFKDKVIPLLEEYFFGDYGKIGLVLGESFISKDKSTSFIFADFSDYDSQTQQDLTQRSVYKIKPSGDWDFISIYQPKPKE